MAGIDRLLIVLATKRMDVLELEPGHTPRLRKGNQAWSVSKSPLSAKEIIRLIAQVTPPAEAFPPPQPQGTSSFAYELEGIQYNFLAKRRVDGWSAAVSVDRPESEEQEETSLDEIEAERRRNARPIHCVADLLRFITENGASDLHLSSERIPQVPGVCSARVRRIHRRIKEGLDHVRPRARRSGEVAGLRVLEHQIGIHEPPAC